MTVIKHEFTLPLLAKVGYTKAHGILPENSLSFMKTWFVYMIRCKDGSLYTGSTNHVIHRWNKHKQGKGAKYLQAHEPKAVVFIEEHPDRSQACKREHEIKQYSKQEKESMITESR